MSTPQVPQLALTLRRLPRRGRAESVTTRDRFGRTILPAAHVLDGRSQFRPAHPLRSLRTLHQVDLEKPSLVVATVLRAPKSTLNASDGSLAPPRVPHGRENLKSPQVLARVAIGIGTMPELEYGRRADARGGRARVGLDSERGPRVLGLESARGIGR